MADNKEREIRKQELRTRVVDAGQLVRKEEKERQREKSRRESGKGRRGRILLFVIVVVLLAVIAGTVVVLMRRSFHSYAVNWTVNFNEEQQSNTVDSDYEDYEVYGSGFLKVTRDGASYLDQKGKTVWNQAYEMNTPYVSVNGEYCAVADQGKTTIFIMNMDGTTGQAETNKPINKIAVARTGVVYALLEDSAASYITVFSREGKALDISIKSVLDGDGYPVDIAVSPDGTELMASFAYIEGGTLQNKVVFYNLGEVGQSAGGNRVVGGFSDDFSGHLAGRVHFSDDTHAQAFYDGGIAFFSTKVLTSPELSAKVELDETIRSVAYDGDYVGIVTDNNGKDSNGDPYALTLYRLNGQVVFRRTFRFNYTGFVVDHRKVLLYNDKTLMVYDANGALKYNGDLNAAIHMARVQEDMTSPFSMNVLVGSTGMMESVKLK
jgi:hypothetical protein